MNFSVFSRTIYKTKSPINGEIVVKEQLGQYMLFVQGLIQSGGIVKKIWRKPFKRIKNLKLKNCLILGLGGGTVVQSIKLHFSGVKIVGIEIDPQIITIGESFFGLSKIKNLKIINADAFGWVKRHSNQLNQQGKFNLVIIDLYLGKKFPKKAESDKFLENINKLFAKNGVAIFNRLKVNAENLNAFEKKLKKYFSQVDLIKTSSNLFFVAREQG